MNDRSNLICAKLCNSSAVQKVLVLMFYIFLYCVIHVDFTKTGIEINIRLRDLFTQPKNFFDSEKYITLKTVLLVD